MRLALTKEPRMYGLDPVKTCAWKEGMKELRGFRYKSIKYDSQSEGIASSGYTVDSKG